MNVAIVYESMFGCTHEIAEAIADGVREADPAAHVNVLPVAEASADRVATAGLLVVGGPTHMRGMTRGTTRRKGLEGEEKTARDKGADFHPEPGAQGPGVRDWFGSLPEAAPGSRAAAFDTRAGFTMAGGAARGIARRLSRHHYELVTEPAGFIVEGAEGPLRTGEAEKARDWGAALLR